jgi:uncharacterized membrane protein YgcG
MRHRILLLVAASVVFGSCTTMYKSGQTPDDVYYSPGREIPAYVQTEENKDENSKYNPDAENYSDYYLRMKTYDRNRWSAFDNDYMYWNDWRWNNQLYYNTFRPVTNWGVSYGSGWGWSTGMYWGTPYYGGGYNCFTPGYYGTPIIVVNPKSYNPAAYAPRNGHLSSYNTANRNYFTDPKTGARTYNISAPSTSPLRTFSNSRRGSNSDSYYRSNNSSGRQLYDNGSSTSPSRSFNNSNNSSNNSSSGSRSSGSSGSSSGGSAPVRSFPKGGG